MIPSRETLAALQQDTGFEARQLEIVIRLRDLLGGVRHDAYLDPRLVLKGGTPLNLCFGPPPRLSVDLDFNYVGAVDRQGMLAEQQPVIDSIERLARRAGYTIQRSAPEHAGRTLFLRYRSALGNEARVQVDVSFLHRVPLATVQVRPIWGPSGTGEVDARVVGTPELVAGKLVALLDRSAARDLYDVARIQRHAELELTGGQARELFVALSGVLDRPLWEYPLEHLDRVTELEVRHTLHPLLRQDDRPTAETLRTDVTRFLAPWVELSDSEREYVERLQRGDLRPELVFPDDAVMADKLRRHPGLLWKVENARQYAARRRSPRGSR